MITVISRNSKRLLAATFGINSQLVVGSVGIIIHELSHLSIALVFGHKITRVKLLDFSQRDGSLGSISSTYDPHSTYQKMGNFLIGIAPIYGCLLAIVVVGKICFPQLFQLAQTTGLTSALTQPATIFSLKGLIGISLLFSITLGGFDLSHSDFAGMASGAISLTLVLVAIGIGLQAFQLPFDWHAYLTTSIIYFLWLMGISLVGNLLVRGLHFLVRG